MNTGVLGGYVPEVLEETDAVIISRDEYGADDAVEQGAWLRWPLAVDYPVKTMDDWLKIKPWYEFSEARFGRDWERVAREHLAAGRVVPVSIPGGFDEPRQLMGEAASA